METVERVDTQCLDIPWSCQRCNALLGYAMDIEGGTYLRIKVKDQYIDVYEPVRIDVRCRKCSFTNTLRQTGLENTDLTPDLGPTE